MSYISKCSSSVCNTLTDIVISDREIVLGHSKTMFLVAFGLYEYRGTCIQQIRWTCGAYLFVLLCYDDIFKTRGLVWHLSKSLITPTKMALLLFSIWEITSAVEC